MQVSRDSRAVLAGPRYSHRWWLLMPCKSGLWDTNYKKTPPTKADKQTRLTCQALFGKKKKKSPLNSCSHPHLSPWSLSSPFPPLFKNNLLTSLQYHLSHLPFPAALAPPQDHFLAAHTSFYLPLAAISLPFQHGHPGRMLLLRRPTRADLPTDKRSAKGKMYLRKYHPDHWYDLSGSNSQPS